MIQEWQKNRLMHPYNHLFQTTYHLHWQVHVKMKYKEVNKIAKEGNYLFTTEKEREDVGNALALEAINIQNANPRLTMQQAFKQALQIMRGGTLSTSQSQKSAKFGQARIK